MPVYKDEQRGTFFCSFYYTDWTGEKKKKTKRGFKLKREAQAFERSFLEQTQGEPTMLFSSLVDLYLADMKTRLRLSTVTTKEYIIRSKILPYFSNLRVDQITPAHIRRWQNELIEQGFADTYLRTIHVALSTIFNYAKRYYNLKENPCQKAGTIGKPKAQRLDFWTPAEYQRFIACFKDEPIAYNAFQLLYWTGIRIGELLALSSADFDFERKCVLITKSYQRISRQDIITEPKTEKSKREILLPDFLCEELQAYISRKAGLEERLFPFTKTYFNSKLDRGCKRSGVKRIRVHDIRHSHASLLVELGFSPLLIAERLGHENIEMTLNIYSHLYPNKQAELVEKLENIGTSFVSAPKPDA